MDRARERDAPTANLRLGDAPSGGWGIYGTIHH